MWRPLSAPLPGAEEALWHQAAFMALIYSVFDRYPQALLKPLLEALQRDPDTGETA